MGREEKRAMTRTVMQKPSPTQNFTTIDSALSTSRTKKNAFNQKEYQTRIRTGNGTAL